MIAANQPPCNYLFTNIPSARVMISPVADHVPSATQTRADAHQQASSRQDVLTWGWKHHTPTRTPPIEYDGNTEATTNACTHVATPGPFIIGVTGRSASGKTTVCDKIIHALGDQRCVLVSLDWFYRGLPPGTRPDSYNFDHPDAFDFHALHDTLRKMTKRCAVSVPMYDFKMHRRVEEHSVQLDVADVIIVEGILTFYDPTIRNMMHMKIFVDEDADICLSRRIRRDVQVRNRTVESVLNQYARFVKPSFEEFIQPTKRYADIVVPRGRDNIVAIDLIIKHIALKMQQDDMRRLFPNLIVMSDSYQSRGLHTIFRSTEASRDDIVFYSERLMRLLIEESLGLLPFERKTVSTPGGGRYYGVGFVTGLAAVSIIPSGETMENSLRAVCNTVRIGKMLISECGGRVKFEKLPMGLEERQVLVLAAVLDDGRDVETAIARLTDSQVGCREDRIMVLSLIVSPQAVARVCQRFSGVRVVVSAVDKGVDDEGRVYPGAGDFATRYFGQG